MTGTVLVLTDHADHTSDLIVASLHARDVNVVRLDPGAGPVHLDAHARLGRWHGRVGDEHRTARLEQVTGVLWRWPTSPTGHPAITDPAERAWAAREDAHALFGILHTLPVRWINHPAAICAADRKPGQLLTARACGLQTPDTLITHNGNAVGEWAADRDICYKALHAQGAGTDSMVVATRITPRDLPSDLGAACTFQEIIPGPSVRLTVVGHDQFAVQLHGTRDELDWRPYQDQLTFRPCAIPPAVTRGVHAYQRAYGLEYGAFDFINGPSGWTFLECNPSGMYGFVELQAGLEITAAIAEHLADPTRTAAQDTFPLAR